jgi:hypothetical protein
MTHEALPERAAPDTGAAGTVMVRPLAILDASPMRDQDLEQRPGADALVSEEIDDTPFDKLRNRPLVSGTGIYAGW